MPMNPTDDEQQWLEELVEDPPWPTSFRLEPFWDGLCSDYPAVIDFFLHGGRDRVAKRSAALLSTFKDPTVPLTSEEVATSLDVLRRALDKDDPNYRYHFATSDLVPTARGGSEILSETRRLTDGTFLTITVHPKHRYSDEDSPISVDLRVSPPPDAKDTQFQNEFERFLDFGTGVKIPDGYLTGNLEAPGALGGVFENAGGWIGPVREDPADLPAPMRLVCVDEQGSELSSVVMSCVRRSIGIRGGAEIALVDSTGVFEVEVQLDPPDDSGSRTGRLNFEAKAISGRPVLEVLPLMRALDLWVPPRTIELRPEYGAGRLGAVDITQDMTLISEGGRLHLEDLATVQTSAPGALRVPDSIDSEFATDLHRFVQMTAGTPSTGTWPELFVTMNPGFGLPAATGEPSSFALSADMSFTIQGMEVPLGTFTTVLESALADANHVDATPDRYRFVPGATDRLYQAAGKAEVVGPEAAKYFEETPVL